MFDIESELKKLPAKPGVYIMRDKNDTVIYVGKAVKLNNRVRSYFRKNNKSARIEKMVTLIDHFEYIVVRSEDEALVLECNLIKKYRPKFNVLLKDDKTYPYIKIDVKDPFPTVTFTRRIINDGSKYFGPYPDVASAKETIRFIKEKFQIRQCKNYHGKDRPCLNYHIKKCLAPCMGYVTSSEYQRQIDQIIMLLEGKISGIKKSMEQEMEEYSKKLEFEKAAMIRDRIVAIERITEKQTVSNISENNIDVIGLYKNDVSVCIEIFFVRGSKMIGREHYFFNDVNDMTPEEIVEGFIKQYYMDCKEYPNKIMLRYELEDKQLIENWLSDKKGKRVILKNPQKGEKLHFVEMAEMNSKITLENKLKDKTEILTELRDVLELEHLPLKIESFDISNISGSYIVAGMVVAINGEMKKNMYRRFRIKTVLQQDDPQCTKEVVSRRIKHSIESPKGGFGTLPDLILADGGITQIKAIKEALAENSVDIPVFGMVKDDHHSTRALINEYKDEFQISNTLFNWITNMQNEVHKTAIEYHRKVRDKEMTKSKLDDIQGIGPKKKSDLLKEFKTIKNIKEASIERLCEVKGITKELAIRLKNEL